MVALVIIHLVHPHVQLSHSWSSCTYILPVAAFSIIYNIPKFFELTTETHTYTEHSNITSLASPNQTELDYPEAEEKSVEETEKIKKVKVFNIEIIYLTNDQMLVVVGTSLRQNPYYYKVYVIYMNLVLNGLIPLVSLVILNILVYLRLRDFSQCVDTSMRNQSVQFREVMLAKVSCIIVAGKMITEQSIFVIFRML